MLLGLSTAVYAQALLPPGAEAPEGLVVQLTEAGLDSLGDLVSPLVPDEPIAIDPISESGFCYEYDFTNGWAAIALDAITVRPVAPSTLDFEIAVTAWVNDPSDEFQLHHDSCITSEETCYGYVLPFQATVTAPATIEVLSDPSGEPVWSVVIDPISFTHGLTADDIVFDSGCSVQDIESVLNFFGLSLYELVIDYAEDYLVEELEQQKAGVEAQIANALGGARYSDTIDLVGVPLTVDVLPRDFRVAGDGLVELAFGTALSAPADDCVAADDPGGSLVTSDPLPGAAELDPSTMAAVQLSDELVNQGLYAVWRSGLLCQEITGGDFNGLPVDTTLLGLLGGDAYAAAFPDVAPIRLETRPRAVPEVLWTGAHDVTVAVRDLEVNVYTDVDGRQARVLGADVTADVGLDAVFDGKTGELELVLDVGADVLDISATSVGMVAVDDAALSAQVDGVIGTLLGTMVSGLVGDALTFPLPSFEGIGLTRLDLHPSADGTWGVAEAEAGPVVYGSEGCAGCAGEPKGGSQCASAPQGGSIAAFLGALIALRRRRA